MRGAPGVGAESEEDTGQVVSTHPNIQFLPLLTFHA